VGQRDERKAKERIYAEVAESTEVTEKRNPRAQRRGTQEHRHGPVLQEEPKRAGIESSIGWI
jgi:hypothetical protein